MTPTQTSPAWLNDFLKPRPEAEFDTLHAELITHLAQCYQPATGPERLKVEEMAQAWIEIWRLHQQTATLKAMQQDQADRHYQLITRNHYARLSRDLHKSPAGHFKALAGHALGIDHLIARWRTVAERLETDQPVDLDHMLDALLATGFSNDIRQQGEAGMQMACTFLNQQKEPPQAVARWIFRSGVKASQTRELYHRINQELKTSLDPEAGRAFLRQLAAKNIDYLKQIRQELAPEYEKARQQYRQASQADRGIVASLRTLEGFRRTQQTILNRLARELHALKRERLRDEQISLEHQARLEAIRQGHAQPRRRTGPKPAAQTAMPGEPFPEAELIQAVQQSAARFEDAQKQPAAPRRSTSIAHQSKDLAGWTNAQLANPALRPHFRQTFCKASRHERKTILRLIAEEKARRCQPPSLQPSG